MSHPSILLVDDDVDVLEWTSQILSGAGYPVRSTSDPREANTMLGDLRNGIDLLVTDVCMPDMNGPDLARQAYRRRPELSVLFISGGFGGAPRFRRGDPRLSKPFTKNEFLDEVQKLVSGDPASPGLARAAAAGWSGTDRRGS
jgi:DNA-binding NtrC family response regulator